MSQQSPQTVTCGLCHYEFQYGAHVCQGCQGTVIYGASNHELIEARKTGAAIWGLLAFGVMYLLPMLAGDQLGWKMGPGWGLGFWGLVPVLGAAVWGGFSQEGKERAEKFGLVRTFRH